MIPKKITDLALALACATTILAGFAAATFAENAPLNRTLADHEYKDIRVGAILVVLADEAGAVLNVEDVPEDVRGGLWTIRVDYETKGSTLRSVLDALAKKTGAFEWHQATGAVNVVCRALKNNPFDEKVAPLDFKGKRIDFICVMNEKVKPLEASLLTLSQSAGDPDAVVSFETKETLTLRQVFDRFAAGGGLSWSAEVRGAPQGPEKVPPKPWPANHIYGAQAASRTTVCFMAKSSSFQSADDDPLNRIVAVRGYKHEGIVSVLIGLGAQAGIPVGVEDVPETTKGSLNAIYVDYETKGGSTLRSISDALMKKTGAFAWQQDGAAINVVSLALKKDNPFDEKVAPLDFKGSQGDFLALMSEKVKSLNASLLGFGPQYCGNPDAVVSFRTKETLSLRQVFNRFGAAAGLRWCAEVREPPQSARELHFSAESHCGFLFYPRGSEIQTVEP